MRKFNAKNLFNRTTDFSKELYNNEMNESKLRDYENLIELVLNGHILLNDNEVNDFLNNFDGYTIALLNDHNEVLKIEITKKNYKQPIRILRNGVDKKTGVIVNIKKEQKLKVKNRVNEYDDLIKQYKNDLVIKKRQTNKLNKKYNELKNYFNSEKQKLKDKNIYGFGINDYIKSNINNKMNSNEYYNEFSKQELINITQSTLHAFLQRVNVM